MLLTVLLMFLYNVSKKLDNSENKWNNKDNNMSEILEVC